jgi:general secretion pathway protein G
MTLLELMVVIAIVSLLAVIAVPSYTAQMDKVRTGRAIAEVGALQVAIDRYELAHGALPARLADLPTPTPLDPWGQPYEYLNFSIAGNAKQRKDGALHPINTTYDLYSIGPNHQTKDSLRSKEGREDIVRGRDGNFIGKGEDF